MNDQGTGTWLLASRVLGRTATTDEKYPHVHRAVWRNGCAACAEAAPDEQVDHLASRRGVGGHACRPAGRGNEGEERWTCADCGASWRPVSAKRAGLTMITWERA